MYGFSQSFPFTNSCFVSLSLHPQRKLYFACRDSELLLCRFLKEGDTLEAEEKRCVALGVERNFLRILEDKMGGKYRHQ